MQNYPNQSIFRNFSANHWNQSETIILKVHSSIVNQNPKKARILFSNAEKMRKTASQEDQTPHLQWWKENYGKMALIEITVVPLHPRKEKGLKPSPTVYLARTSGPKRELRFSVSGNLEIEQSYRTHYISPVNTVIL